MPNLTQERLTEIEARYKAATDGPWIMDAGGHINDKTETRNLANTNSYRDTNYLSNAAFIAHARQDLPDCLAEIKRLRADMAEIVIESGKVDIDNWPAQQHICQSIANKSLGRDINGKEPENE